MSSKAALSPRHDRRLQLFFDHTAALFPHELHHVVRPAAALPARTRSLPAGKRLRARPGTGGRATSLVHIDHADFDLVEELLHLRFVLREETRRQAVLDLVGFFGPLRERVGTGSAELELDDGATVADALAYVAATFSAQLDDVQVARNQDVVGSDEVLSNGDELAFLPPYGGG